MIKRPLSVTIIGCIYIATGAIGFVYHLAGFKGLHPFPYGALWVSLLRLTAILCGAFMLRGRNWARWLALAWIAFHVAISAMHSAQELLFHVLVFAILTYFLCRSAAANYFREDHGS